MTLPASDIEFTQAAAADAAVAKGAWVSQLVLAHEHLVLQDADVVAAALAHFRTKPALGFSDCLVLEIARKAGHQPPATFDKALGRLIGAQRLKDGSAGAGRQHRCPRDAEQGDRRAAAPLAALQRPAQGVLSTASCCR